jgi:type III secretory pathway component EscV
VYFVGRGYIDAFNMALAGVHRTERKMRANERAVTLSDSAAGCMQVISPGDRCYVGTGNTVVRCNGFVLSNNDKCWFHLCQQHGRRAWSDEVLVHTDTLCRLIEESAQSKSAKFFGVELTDYLLDQMKSEVARRQALQVIGAVPLSVASHVLMYGIGDKV